MFKQLVHLFLFFFLFLSLQAKHVQPPEQLADWRKESHQPQHSKSAKIVWNLKIR